MNTDTFSAPGWRVLAGVGIGYGIASVLVFVAFFLIPWAVYAAIY